MSNQVEWLVPNVIRRHGVHVLSGPGVRKVAVALAERLRNGGHPVELLQPHAGLTEIGQVWPLNEWRGDRCVLIVAPGAWKLFQLQLVELTADVCLHQQDAWRLFVVKGGATACFSTGGCNR